MLTALLTALSSCSGDSGSSPLPEEADGPFQISFRIVTRTVGSTSRAADIAGDEKGFTYENYLDVNDLRYILFDKDQNFISDITPKAEIASVNDDYTIYEVRAKLDEPYFVDNINGFIDFYILILANYSGWDISFPPLQAGTSLQDLFTATQPMSPLPVTAMLMKAATDDTARQLFPMAGLQYFHINGLNLLNTTADQPYDLSDVNFNGKDINMLRALTKIEIIDRINISEAEGYVFSQEDAKSPLRIQSAEIDGYFSEGLLLPALDIWKRNVTYPETQQVNAPTLATASIYAVPPTLNADNEYAEGADFSGCSLDFAYDPAATAARQDKCPVYSCYLYEYSLASIGTRQAPYFRVTTKGSEADADPHYDSLTLPFRMTTTTAEGNVIPLPALLRNHIYRYEITGISQQVEFKWTVCPMDIPAPIGITFN